MKIKLTIFLLVIFVANFYGQNSLILHPESRLGNNQNLPFTQKNNVTRQVLNNLQKLDSTVYAVWDSATQNYTETNKDVFVYNAFLQVADHISLQRLNNVWKNETRRLNTYDQNQFLSEVVYKEWQQNTWLNQTKINFTYNQQGDILSIKYAEWQNRTWADTAMKEFAYNADGTLLSETYYIMNNDGVSATWQPDFKAEYSYDTFNQLASKKSYVWDNLSRSWQNNENFTFIFDNQVLQQIISKVWDPNIASWLNSTQTLYTYDNSGYLTQILSKTWDVATNLWLNSNRTVLVRDAWHNILRSTDQFWESEAWVNEYEIENVYDNAYALNDLILPENANDWQFLEEINEFFSHMLKKQTAYRWDATGNQWENNELKTFYYTSGDNVTALAKQNNDELKIYPNPFNRIINIRLPVRGAGVRFSLFDITGKIIYQNNNFSNNQLLLPNLSAGIYFYQINDDRHVYKGQLIKR